MSRAARLLQLLEHLRLHRQPVAGAALAQELGVSLRTLYRDIGTLREQGALIEGDPGVGYVLKPGFTLPPLMFGEDELEALVLGARWVASHAADPELAAAARSALNRIGATLELAVLFIEGHAANQERYVDPMVLAVFDEVFLDLRGELARRLEDQRARHARPGAALFEPRDHRQHEGGGLAGAGLGDAQHVLALQGMGDGAGLDRRRGLVTRVRHGGENLWRKAKLGECERFGSGLVV